MQRLGPHTIEIEPNRLMLLTFHGDCTLEQAKELFQALHAHGESGTFDVILDVAELGNINAGARAVWVRINRPYPFRHFLVYAPRFAQRMLVSTMYRAGKTLVPQHFQWDLHFASSIEEGRKLLKELESNPNQRA